MYKALFVSISCIRGERIKNGWLKLRNIMYVYNYNVKWYKLDVSVGYGNFF